LNSSGRDRYLRHATLYENNTAGEELARREAELRDFVDNSVVALHRVGADGTILWANRAEMELLGYTPEEYIGHNISEFHVDADVLKDILTSLSRGETLHGREACLRRKDGSLRRVVIYSNAYLEAGKFVHTRCFTLDVTEQAAAIEAGQRLAAIVTSSEDAIASKDLNGIITSWNGSAERMFGWKADEIIGRPVLVLIPPELHSDEDLILGKIRRGERIEHFETVRVRKDGERIAVSLTVSPIKDAGGRIIGAAKIVRDITERKRTEDGLRRAEKMAATGRLAATIAHEINNPMQALANLLALIAHNTNLDQGTRQLVELADSELTRMSHIARQMLSFYRESSTALPVKVNDLLDEVLGLTVTGDRAKGLRIERRYDTTAEIYGFPIELRQLFVNLITNAVEAVGARGRIRIHVADARDWKSPSRHGVRVVIADTGPGIAPDIRRQIFQPFFTTKLAKGTGLGLWVVQGIVDKHEGTLRMRTSVQPGRSGTVFSIFLPQQPSAALLYTRATASTENAA